MRKSMLWGLLATVVLAAGIGGYFAMKLVKPTEPFETMPHHDFVQAYALVDSTVSESAPIRIHVPAGTDPVLAQSHIEFTPEIKGEWGKTVEENNTVVFQPADKLKVRHYYTVSLATGSGAEVAQDFYADEDPAIISILPKADAPADEKSNISIVFNRPMVPLSTVDTQVAAANTVPVQVTPVTPGHFAWVGTHTLQFIPDATLIPSANYTVDVSAGLRSDDSMQVAPMKQTFTTRPLRYTNFPFPGSQNNQPGTEYDTVVYNEPIRIGFNEAFDLERTRPEISVVTADGKAVPVVAEYGQKGIYNRDTKKTDRVPDETQLLIYNATDKHGRPRYWDFDTKYSVTIKSAYPKGGGDIYIKDPVSSKFASTGIVSAVTATSPRTQFATPDFFDPQGELHMSFYEEINKDTTSANAEGLKNVTYGTKCKEAEEDVAYSFCEEVEDRHTLVLKFDPARLKNGTPFTVIFSVVKNTSGIQINTDPIVETVKVVPDLKVLTTTPAEGAKNADITSLVVCSTTPLAVPAKEDVSKMIAMSDAYQFDSWEQSMPVPAKPWPEGANAYWICDPETFQTAIHYGLMPEHTYKAAITVTDHFGETAKIERSFTTQNMPGKNLMFYNLQNSYSVTVPDKTTLTYAAVNMDYVNMDICTIAAQDMLLYLEQPLDAFDPPSAIKGCTATVSKKIDLPPKYWIRNYFKVNLRDYVPGKYGHYILTFSHPDYKADTNNNAHKQVYERAYLTVTDLSAVEKRVELQSNGYFPPEMQLDEKTRQTLKNMYWVVNSRTLAPVTGASVSTFTMTPPVPDQNGQMPKTSLKPGSTGTTGTDGIAQLLATLDTRGAVVKSGDDSAILSSSSTSLRGQQPATQATRTYLYTDRPIYRPGDEVHFKGLYRVGFNGNYQVVTDKKITVTVFDSKDQEMYKQELPVSPFGTFSADVMLDTGAPLGTYRVESGSNDAFFDVEEYVPSPFKVDVTTDKDEYIAGDTVNMHVAANYYFGVPLEGGTVEYSIAAQQYYFDRYTDDYFSFGSSWYDCFRDCSFGDTFILRNKVSLDSNGKATIAQQLDFKKLFKNEENPSSKIFAVFITVKNSSGQTVSTQKSFITHAGEFYVGVKSSSYFVAKGQPFDVKVKSVDTQGKNKQVSTINLEIDQIDWITNKRLEVDGAYYYRTEKRKTSVKKQTVSTDADGNWHGSFALPKEGDYEVNATGIDSRGNHVHDSYELYVGGEGETVNFQPTNDTSLNVVTNKQNVSVGDKASIVIQSPFQKAKALVTLERGDVYDYKIIDVTQSLYEYTFDVDEKFIPNVVASVVLLSDKPDVKYGEVEFAVNKKEKALNVAVTSDKKEYLPGEKVSLNFKVTDDKGKPVVAELSAAVVDVSVLALKGNPKKDPVEFFYDYFPHSVSTLSNIADFLHEVEIPKGKGGGGGAPQDLAKKKRGVFKDTAFWKASLITDADGKATVSFTLPDNVTSWQVESVAITQDTHAGAGYREFIAHKQLMLTPIGPRFVIPGDTFALGAKVFNQTGSDQTLKVHFDSKTLALTSDETADKDLSIKTGDTQTIFFKAHAPGQMLSGEHSFILSAANNDYKDEVELAVPIMRNETYETTATSGFTSAPNATEHLYVPGNVSSDEGGLTIHTSATLATFLSTSLQSLLDFPYGCTEQIASKLAALAVVKKGLSLPNIGDAFLIKDVNFNGTPYSLDDLVKVGLAKIYVNQTEDGSFSYYPGLQSDPYVTMETANALKDLKDAGYQINDDALMRAADALKAYAQGNQAPQPQPMKEGMKEEQMPSQPMYAPSIAPYVDMFWNNPDFAILDTYTVYRTLKDPKQIPDAFRKRISDIVDNKQMLEEQLSNETLVYLALLLNAHKDVFGDRADPVYSLLENRVEIDARGAFVSTNEQHFMWNYYETPVKDTALLLKAFVQKGEDNPLTERMLRWLLASRAKDGSWGTTNNTMTVIGAFTDYINWRKEFDSNFTLNVSIDGAKKDSTDFNPQNIFTQHTLDVPMNDLQAAVQNFEPLSTVVFDKENHSNAANDFYYDLALKYFLPVDAVPPRDEGFTIHRSWFASDDEAGTHPLSEANVGDVLRGELTLVVPKDRNFVAVEDFIPAGTELINFNLATSDQSLKTQLQEQQYRDQNKEYDSSAGESVGSTVLYPDIVENRDDRLFLFMQHLSPGQYKYTYFIRVGVPGTFLHLPAVVSEMYFSENFARTKGEYFAVDPSSASG